MTLLLFIAMSQASDRLPAADGWLVERFTVDDGLPSNATYQMAVDAQGRVVVGTTDGLVTYDGEVLSVLREEVTRTAPRLTA